jgi:hypothetical protein
MASDRIVGSTIRARTKEVGARDELLCKFVFFTFSNVLILVQIPFFNETCGRSQGRFVVSYVNEFPPSFRKKAGL